MNNIRDMLAETDFQNFEAHYQAGKTQLVWQWIEADLETPVSAWLKLCHCASYSILLESVEGGTVLGRYSAIALDPDILWRCHKGQAELSRDFKNWETASDNDALSSLKDLRTESRIDVVPDDLPPMASSGLFGYMGYDMIRLVEDIPDTNPDSIGIPDSIMMRPTLVLAFDNIKHMMCISTPVRHHAENSAVTAFDAYNAAQSLINEAVNKLEKPINHDVLGATTALSGEPEISSNTSRAQYHDMVKKAVEYIHAGDIFQVVPSQRFSMKFDMPSFELYRTLRRLNPSPFLFHLRMEDMSLVGSSPEILVRVRDNAVAIRPIAGTRKRGATPAEDKTLADDLLNDPKERAEHLMLLDLARNDIGRIATTGSINVTDQFFIEYYSHVMHIVSHVEGHLRADIDPLDALFSGFPAGTVSGAPKIRAMEIIDELESERRSFYAGCIGYLDGRGNVDSCITLRTALIKNNTLYVQAGGGVVADSDPEFEYQESCNKARAILAAAEMTLAQAPKKSRKDSMKRKAS